MELVKDYESLIDKILLIILSITALVISSMVKNIPGKKWLVATNILWLLGYTFSRAFELYEIIELLFDFGNACFGIFLFALWSNTRLKINIRNLLFSFDGRISRSAFWLIGLIIFPVGMSIGLTVGGSEAKGMVNVILWIVYFCWLIVSMWISFSVYAKRWHDCGKSGWMSLILFIPIIGALWLIIYLGFTKGNIGVNEYGEDTILINKQENIITENA